LPLKKISYPQDKYGPEEVYEITDKKINLTGYLVIDNTKLGPGKGGFRMTNSVTVDEVFRLARTMTWKNALAGLPFGGAKAGIRWPGGSSKLKELFVRTFARELKPLLVKKYISAPDVNVGEHEIGWFVEEAGDYRAATGKPANLGGLPHELGSTGWGVAISTQTAAKIINLNLKGATVAIDGFGNVGRFSFKFLEQMGAKIVAVSDSHGAIWQNSGIKFADALSSKESLINEIYSVTNLKNVSKINYADLFTLDVDILIPASLSDVITETNVNKIKAKLVVSGANTSMSPECEVKLFERGIWVVPDFVANSGGVISSYAELESINQPKMFELINKKVSDATEKVMNHAVRHHQSPRLVALELAEAILNK